MARTAAGPPAPWRPEGVPDQSGRVAVVTGANGGIGIHVASSLAAAGATVILACRDAGRADTALADLAAAHPHTRFEVVPLDLADLGSVRSAAADIGSRVDRLDLLIANAGVSMSPAALSRDGIELQFATNHLGHFLLVGLLLDRLRATEGSRVVTVTSVMETIGRLRLERLDEPAFGRVRAYARSKLAVLVYALELDRRLQAAGASTMALASHPGSAATGIARHIPTAERALAPLAWLLQQSAEAGAAPVLRAALDPDALGGQLYAPGGPFHWRGPATLVPTPRRAVDRRLGAQLWSTSEALSGAVIDIS